MSQPEIHPDDVRRPAFPEPRLVVHQVSFTRDPFDHRHTVAIDFTFEGTRVHLETTGGELEAKGRIRRAFERLTAMTWEAGTRHAPTHVSLTVTAPAAQP